MTDYKDDLVQQTVRRRMVPFKLFAVHFILSIGAVLLVILGGAMERVTAEAAVVIALTAMLSLMVHGIWLGLTEVRKLITRQEIERLRLLQSGELAYDEQANKRKRDVRVTRDANRLLDDEDDPIDLDDYAVEAEAGAPDAQ